MNGMSVEINVISQTIEATPGTPRTVLEVRDLCVAYGKVEALSNANLKVGEGQIVTVIGPNGAGKTTMLSAIMGLLESRGQVHFDGEVELVPKVERMVARGMNLVPEKRELFAEMSVEDNLLLGAFQRYRSGLRDHPQTMAEVFHLFPRLEERRTQLAGTLSGGERQMLAVGRALMAKPKLLMLDEPSLGLAPLIVREIFRIISELRRRGVSILLVEQNARAALQVADYAYVLETGEIAMEGPAKQLADDPRVIEAYLGLGGKHQDKLAT
jgi:branched-chain amino acid transport system ATP-binding protein